MFPGRQLHIGLCLITWHCVLIPQDPLQGFIHFWLLHARSREQSELRVHSGLQVGGLPKKPGTHEQTGCSFTTLHWLLGPQGEGLQGLADMGPIKRVILKQGDRNIHEQHIFIIQAEIDFLVGKKKSSFLERRFLSNWCTKNVWCPKDVLKIWYVFGTSIGMTWTSSGWQFIFTHWVIFQLNSYKPFGFEHRTNAFPDIPGGQVHIVIWL